MSGISVVICCYNSSGRLSQTLHHLANQKTTLSLEWEIIVVDNASTDNTSAVARTIWDTLASKPAAGLRIVHEERQGLSEARKRGVMEALYDYIVFCDDDNWLCDDYLVRAYALMEGNAEIGVLGGRGVAVGERELPFWFSTFQGAYAVGCQALRSGDITTRGGLMGAGMVVRRSFLKKLFELGCTPVLSDRKGNSLISGGDDEISRWFILGGYKLWYDEDLVFSHLMPSARLTKEYYEQLRKAQIESYHLLLSYDRMMPRTSLFSWFRWHARRIIKGLSESEKNALRNITIIRRASLGTA